MYGQVDDVDFDPSASSQPLNAEAGCLENDWLDPDCGSDAKADSRTLQGLRDEAAQTENKP